MKLGALLLQGFLKKGSINRVIRKGVRSLNQKSSVLSPHGRASRSATRSQPNRQSFPKTIALIPTVLAPQTQTGLSASEMIRPDGALRASMEAFLKDQRSPHTRNAYGKDLKRFMKYLIELKVNSGIDSLDRKLIIGYKDFLLSEELLHTTIDRHLATLKSFFRWLVEDGVIEQNIAENVRFLNPKRESTTKGFTDEEVVQMLSLPDLYTKSGSLHYAILMVLFYCGLRRSELCELRTRSIGIERGHHFLKLIGKGNSERIVVMTEPVWNSIEHYARMTRKHLNQDLPLFSPVRNNRTLVRDKPIDSSMVFYIVTRYAKLAGIKHRVSPHSCRATAISNARDHQVPDRAIQEFAGWASPSMITRYDKRKSALEKSAVHSISYGAEIRKIPSAELIQKLEAKS